MERQKKRQGLSSLEGKNESETEITNSQGKQDKQDKQGRPWPPE